MLSRVTRAEIAVGVVILGVVVFAIFMSIRFPAPKLAEISIDEVPVKLREEISSSASVTNYDQKWRVSQREDWYHWVVYTYRSSMRGNSWTNMTVKAIEVLEDGSFGRFLVGGGHSLPPEGSGVVFSFGYGTGTHRRSDGEIECILEASGIAFDTMITKIVGETVNGQIIESTPVNGFWLLLTRPALKPDSWVVIKAVDKNGKVLYEQEVTR